MNSYVPTWKQKTTRERFAGALFTDIEKVARGKFVKYLEGGNKLTYDQLRKLNGVWKDDYVDHIFLESEAMQEYVKEQIENVQIEGDEVAALQRNIEDAQDTWDEAVTKIDKAIFKSAEKNGISRKVYKKL